MSLLTQLQALTVEQFKEVAKERGPPKQGKSFRYRHALLAFRNLCFAAKKSYSKLIKSITSA